MRELFFVGGFTGFIELALFGSLGMCGKVVDGIELGDDEFFIPMDEFLVVPDLPIDGLEIIRLDGLPCDAIFRGERDLLCIEASVVRVPDPLLMDEGRGLLDAPALLLELLLFFLEVMNLIEETFQGNFDWCIFQRAGALVGTVAVLVETVAMLDHDGLAVQGSGTVDTKAVRAGPNPLPDGELFLRDGAFGFLDGTDARTRMALHLAHGISEFLPVLQGDIEVFVGVQRVIFGWECQHLFDVGRKCRKVRGMPIEGAYTPMTAQAGIHEESVFLLLNCIGEDVYDAVFPCGVLILVDDLLIVEVADEVREVFMDLILLFRPEWWHGIEVQVIFKLEHGLPSPSMRYIL